MNKMEKGVKMKTLRMLTLALVVAGVGLAAQWDGTKGTITLKTDSDGRITVFSVTSSDPTVSLLSISVTFATPGILPALPQITSQTFPRRSDSLGHGLPSLVTFSIPESEISRIIVTEFRAGQSEMFTESIR
jgi:hypothetical protein